MFSWASLFFLLGQIIDNGCSEIIQRVCQPEQFKLEVALDARGGWGLRQARRIRSWGSWLHGVNGSSCHSAFISFDRTLVLLLCLLLPLSPSFARIPLYNRARRRCDYLCLYRFPKFSLANRLVTKAEMSNILDEYSDLSGSSPRSDLSAVLQKIIQGGLQQCFLILHSI